MKELLVILCATALIGIGLVRCTPAYTRVQSDSHNWGHGVSHVVLTPAVIAELQERWTGNTETEWAACLAGSIVRYGELQPDEESTWADDRVYVVDTILPADVEGVSENRIDSVHCATPGRIHSHPASSRGEAPVCYRSPTDRKSFWSAGYIFEVVWCGDFRWVWYTRNGEQGEVSWLD